jgi:hypothetical protein
MWVGLPVAPFGILFSLNFYLRHDGEPPCQVRERACSRANKLMYTNHCFHTMCYPSSSPLPSCPCLPSPPYSFPPPTHRSTHPHYPQSLYFRMMRYPYFFSVPLGLALTYLYERRARRIFLANLEKKRA